MKGSEVPPLTILLVVTIPIAVFLLIWASGIFTKYTQGFCFNNAYEPLSNMVREIEKGPARPGSFVVIAGDCIDEIKISDKLSDMPGDAKCILGLNAYIGIDISKATIGLFGSGKKFYEFWKQDDCIPSSVKIIPSAGEWDCSKPAGTLKGGGKTYCLTYEPSSPEWVMLTCEEMKSANGKC
jgi:hypothetical protein